MLYQGSDFRTRKWIIIKQTDKHLFAKRAFIIFGLGVHWGQEWSFPRTLQVKEPITIDLSNAEYETFDEWFYEIENYSSRGERLLDGLTMSDGNVMELMRNAWDASRIANE